ncbi:hypothetical protein TPHV1_120072 [Treponema phagedenis]|uniref:Uncharacterized protein n=1 Tax=Treponema phagedenis TaxID=162 RepID=A0A0B7GR68_TREPH|nr:hypothetical protein TPHV1_120072 [Treponema phagedenis]
MPANYTNLIIPNWLQALIKTLVYLTVQEFHLISTLRL